MNVFFDLEFTGLTQNTTPVSVGLVSEAGWTFYAELNDYDESQLDDWFRQNVWPQLKFPRENDFTTPIYAFDFKMKGDKAAVRDYLTRWLNRCETDRIEIWGDCPQYDWVVFCGLFGGGLHLPRKVSTTVFDLATLFKIKGIDPNIQRERFLDIVPYSKHNALWDAQVCKACYSKLIKMVG